MAEEQQNQVADSGPAQISTPAQYPTATRIENGIAYDISGKALGPYNEAGAQPAQKQDFFAQFGGQADKVEPQKASQPNQDFFAQFGGRSDEAQSAQPAATISARPHTVENWLENLKSDLDNGTDSTWVGWLLRKAGAKGLTYGVNPEVGHLVGGPAYGSAELAHGSLSLQKPAMGYESNRTPVQNINEMFSGAGHLLGPVAATPFGAEALPFIAIGGTTQAGATEIAKKMGADDDTAQLIGNISGLIVGGKAMSKTHLSDFESQVHGYINAQTQYVGRLKEVNVAENQAFAAESKAAQARVDYSNGRINQQQMIDAENLASEARSNAGKAQKALEQATESRNQSGVKMRQTARKLQKPEPTEDQTKILAKHAGAKEDFQKSIPSAPKGPAKYTDVDYDRARPYLEREHKQEAANTVEGGYNALDNAQKSIENKVKPYVEQYADKPIVTNPITDVRDALRDNPKLSFVQEGMKHLTENYGDLSNLTVGEADKLRIDLNSMNRPTLAQSGWDISTRLDNDPEFAARYYLAESLRNGEYNTFENEGVKGIRELRQDETSIIRLRNAAQRAMPTASRMVRGSGESGLIRKGAAKAAPYVGAGVGATAGAGIGGFVAGPVGAEVGGSLGAAGGAYFGKKLGTMINPGDLTRDALLARSMKVEVGNLPKGIVEVPRAPEAMSPADMTAIMRENGPLHSELATHYGVFSGAQPGENTYAELAQRFKEDIQDKAAHGIPLDGPEKKLLGMLNQADDADRLAARQKAMEEAASGKVIGRFNAPDKVEPPMQAPNIGKSGLTMHEALVHDLAHVIVGSELGLEFPDGIRSHLHPQNGSGNVMTAPIDWSKFVDKDGVMDPNKLTSRIADLATTYVAGGVANDLFHDIPFTESKALGTDLNVLKQYMKRAGMSEVEASKAIAQAAETAQMILARPGMKEILDGHASVREAGLSDKYHFSPERIEQVLEDVKEGTKRESTSTTGKSSGNVRSGKRATEAANAGTGSRTEEGIPPRAEGQNAKGVRQPGQGPAEGKAGAVQVKPEEPAVAAGVKPEEEEKLLMNERQSPLKENFKVEIRSPEGSVETKTIQAHSFKAAIREAEKTPGYSAIEVTRGEKQPDDLTYRIPTGKLKSMPESGNRAPESTIRHELGHAMVGQKNDMVIEGMLRHTHPDMGRGSRAAVQWDTDNIIRNGRPIPERLGGLLEGLAGGIAADEVFNGLDRKDNINFTSSFRSNSDGNMMRRFIQALGTPSDQTEAIVNAAVDRAKEYLTNEHVSGIINENVPYREEGLSSQFHYSPQRLKAMHTEAQRRMGVINEANNRAISGAVGEVGGTNVGGAEGAGTSGAPRAIAAEGGFERALESEWNRQQGEATPLLPQNPAVARAGDLKPQNPAVAVSPEDQALVNKAKWEENPNTGYRRLVLTDEYGNRMGVIAHDNYRIRLADLGEKYQNRGIGRALYERAFEDAKNNGVNTLMSDTSLSPDAARVWDSLAKSGKYNITAEPSNEVNRGKVGNVFDNLHTQYAVHFDQPIKPQNPAVATDRVSTRLPEGKNATENPLQGEPLVIGRASLQQAPEKLQQKFADTVRSYPGVKIPDSIKDPAKVSQRFVNHVADNLKFLYNQVEPDKQVANAKWYESANKLANEMAQKHGVTEPQAAGVIATQSPQKDWDMNVSLARRVADIYSNQQDTVATPQMIQKGNDIVNATEANEDLAKALPFIEGKKLSEVDPSFRAAWVRLYDEAHNPREFHYIDPGTGEDRGLRTKANGDPSKVAWGTLTNIENALSILDNGSRENISERLGGMHKVRNFYNNIVDPSNDQDVTIDTHAVAAGLMQPLAGKSAEVLDNFGKAGKHAGTGTMGTYPLYADAYRQAAQDLGIKPRELQSVVWEHIRNMFPSEWKNPGNEKIVKEIWSKYSDGKQSLNATRQQILDLSEQAQRQVADSRAKAQKKVLDKQAKAAYAGGIGALGAGNGAQ